MHPFAATALVGTAQRPYTAATTGTPFDALATPLTTENEPERALLLRSGAWAIYTQAGYLAERECPAVAPAPDDTLPACSAGAAALLSVLLKGSPPDTLLPEALTRLRRAGLRLPYDTLPDALALRDESLRLAILPLLGERGRWLSQFNAAWSWVEGLLPLTTGTVPMDAETIWQEGAIAQRITLLRMLRAHDPALAREWLAADWKTEKAEARQQFLHICEVGLSLADEPVLERALKDRSAGVRSTAAGLLARIPSSFAARMRQRADALLRLNPRASRIDATVPKTLPQDWQDDGVEAKPPVGVGERAHWLAQVMGWVAPDHWEQRFGMPPEQLIEATEGNNWQTPLVHGWSRAAIQQGADAWALPLWLHWAKTKHSDGVNTREMRALLAPLIPANVLADLILRLGSGLAVPNAPSTPTSLWSELLAALPAPWTREVATFYLSGLRDYARNLSPKSTGGEPWLEKLSLAALALPVESFAEVTAPWDFPDDNAWIITTARHHIEAFVETLRTRQRLVEEIPL